MKALKPVKVIVGKAADDGRVICALNDEGMRIVGPDEGNPREVTKWTIFWSSLAKGQPKHPSFEGLLGGYIPGYSVQLTLDGDYRYMRVPVGRNRIGCVKFSAKDFARIERYAGISKKRKKKGKK